MKEGDEFDSVAGGRLLSFMAKKDVMFSICHFLDVFFFFLGGGLCCPASFLYTWLAVPGGQILGLRDHEPVLEEGEGGTSGRCKIRGGIYTVMYNT